MAKNIRMLVDGVHTSQQHIPVSYALCAADSFYRGALPLLFTSNHWLSFYPRGLLLGFTANPRLHRNQVVTGFVQFAVGFRAGYKRGTPLRNFIRCWIFRTIALPSISVMERRLSEVAGIHGGARSRREFLSLFLAALRRGRGVADLRKLGPSGAVKFAADLSVAMTAVGRTWSRSIISQSRKVCPVLVDFIRCCKAKSCNNFGLENAKGVSRSNLLRMRKNLCNMMRKRSKSSGVRRLNASCKRSMRRMLRAVLRTEEKKKKQSEIGDVNSRVEVLKNLVPGGETMDAPLLLEEAFHYIEALQTQVESMRALLHYFGGGFHPTSL